MRLRNLALKVSLLVGLVLMNNGCRTAIFSHSEEKVDWISGKPTGTRKHLSITPTGEKIFLSAIDWYYRQPEHRAMPANCANNVSDVLVGVRNDFQRYRNELIPGVERQIQSSTAVLNNKTYKGRVIKLPRNEAEIVKVLNANFPNGKIPTGALIAGCLNPDCSGKAGDGHIAIVGDLDEKGRVQVYHNNWFRPENTGGDWREFMVSQEHLKRGIKRQWMPTPWMKFGFQDEKLQSAKIVLPEIDDLDPYNYYLSIYMIPEILAEIDQGQRVDALVSPVENFKTKGMVCRIVANEAAIKVYLNKQKSSIIGSVKTGTVLVWMADADKQLSQVQVRIDGKLFGAGGTGTPEAYIESQYLKCPL